MAYISTANLPIFMALTYDKVKTMKFPINPEVLEKSIPSSSESKKIVGLGEIAIPTEPGLAEMTISSFFWEDKSNLILPFQYVTWLEQWQFSKRPAFFTVTKFNYSMWVTCESFRHWRNAGEESDIYYELKLKEYKPYGAQVVNPIKNEKLLDKVSNVISSVATGISTTEKILDSFILIDIPLPNRTSNKEPIYTPYTVKNKDTLMSISKKVTGDSKNWKDLYNANVETIGNVLGEIKEGMKLVLPDVWVNNSTYNIISSDTGVE